MGCGIQKPIFGSSFTERFPVDTGEKKKKNGAVSPFLPLGYNIKVRERPELQGSETREKPSCSGNPFIQKLS